MQINILNFQFQLILRLHTSFVSIFVRLFSFQYRCWPERWLSFSSVDAVTERGAEHRAVTPPASMPMIPAMPALIPASNKNTMMQASHIANKYLKLKLKHFVKNLFFLKFGGDWGKNIKRVALSKWYCEGLWGNSESWEREIGKAWKRICNN